MPHSSLERQRLQPSNVVGIGAPSPSLIRLAWEEVSWWVGEPKADRRRKNALSHGEALLKPKSGSELEPANALEVLLSREERLQIVAVPATSAPYHIGDGGGAPIPATLEHCSRSPGEIRNCISVTSLPNITGR